MSGVLEHGGTDQVLRIVVHAADRAQVFPVPREPQVFGSAADCALRCGARGVSRHHAKVVGAAGGLHIEDLDSRNGIWLAGKRCGSAVLEAGQRVQLGEAWLALEDVSSSDAEPELLISAVPGSTGDPSASGTDVTGEGFAPPGSVAAVLRLIRLLQRESMPPIGAPRGRLLSSARATVGAGALIVFRITGGEVAVVECSGALPDESVLDTLAAVIARRRQGEALAVETETGTGFASRGAGSDWALVALPADLGSPLAPGSADLISYLAEHLLAEPAPTDREPVGEGRRETEPPLPPGMVIGGSATMRELLRGIRSTIGSDLHVLLLGECGTGKELVARLIHSWGPYAKGPFVPINCAAIPAELFEAEMFGVHGRAATGVDPRSGHFARAERGTIFLDEIGDLREDLQAKLLRVLQEREIAPVGASGARRIDVRVISASNRDLESLVGDGKFRQDLYYRLRGRQFHVPPLRERKEDLAELALTFVSRFAAQHQRRILGVSRRALRHLSEHDWPGNIRELENACEAAVLLCPHGGVIRGEHLPDLYTSRYSGSTHPAASEASTIPPLPEASLKTRSKAPTHDERGVCASLRSQMDEVERRTILGALENCNGNRTQAAKLLGVSRYGLRLKMRRLGLTASADEGRP